MDVACDACPGKDARIQELMMRYDVLAKRRESDVAAVEAKRVAEVEDLRERYERTVDDQWRDLERLRQKETKWNQDERQVAKASAHADSEAWQKVAATLDIKLVTGYQIDEARVLQQLRVERSAASLLRAEVAALKQQLSTGVDEFARQREEFMAHLQDRNGAAKLEAPKTKV